MASFDSVHDATDHTGIPGVGGSSPGNLWTMSKTASQTVTSNADTIVTFDRTDIDGGGSVVDLANDRFVAPATGFYLAFATWTWEATIPTSSARIVFMVGGSPAAAYSRLSPDTTEFAANGGANGYGALSLTAGDFVTLVVHPGGSVTPTVRGNASVHLSSSFTLVRIT